ncbi:MAG: response regulator [Patescibacteria group bacterium]
MKQTILLVEDEQPLVRLYQQVFERHSTYTLLVAQTKEQGIELAIKHRPKLLLLDLIIPERPGEMVAYDRRVGFDLLADLRQHPKTRQLVVFVFSNIDTHEDRIRSEELGVAEYLVKAAETPASVIEKVHQYVTV